MDIEGDTSPGLFSIKKPRPYLIKNKDGDLITKIIYYYSVIITTSPTRETLKDLKVLFSSDDLKFLKIDS